MDTAYILNDELWNQFLAFVLHNYIIITDTLFTNNQPSYMYMQMKHIA